MMRTRDRERHLRDALAGMAACAASLRHGPHEIIERNYAWWQARAIGFASLPERQTFAPPHYVDQETAYGSTVRLPFQIRVF